MSLDGKPVVVSCQGLHASIGTQVLFHDLAFSIHEGERIALVGQNGTGKTTLMRLLVEPGEEAGRTLSFRRGLRRGFLPQELPRWDGLTLRQVIEEGCADLRQLLLDYETVSHTSPAFAVIESAIERYDVWNLDARINELCTGLRTPSLDRDASGLSGGEARRVALARALAGLPDLLILDEPTNHLDTQTIEWLEDFIRRYRGTCLFVTHDRAFLDSMATRVLELCRGSIYSHDGSYRAYLEGKAEREAAEEQAEYRRRRFLSREIEWLRRGPKARTTKSISRVNRVLDAMAQKPLTGPDESVEVLIPRPPKLGNKILEFRSVNKSLGEKKLIDSFSFAFSAGDKLGIIGPNGVGKTTLINLILERLTPDSGEIIKGDLTRFNAIDQQRTVLNDANSVFHEVNEGKESVAFGEETLSTWTYLRRFLFSDERIRTEVGKLSGGERNRLALAKMLKFGGNLLILDEPTNDLDLDTLRVLEDALEEFEGCLLIVSHDRFFLNRICTGILAFEGNGTIVYQPGDYDYYLEKKKERDALVARTRVVAAPVAVVAEAAPRKRLTWKEQQELAGMEEAILIAEDEVSQIEQQLSSPDFYAKFAAQAGDMARKLEEARGRVAVLYARWEELESLKG